MSDGYEFRSNFRFQSEARQELLGNFLDGFAILVVNVWELPQIGPSTVWRTLDEQHVRSTAKDQSNFGSFDSGIGACGVWDALL